MAEPNSAVYRFSTVTSDDHGGFIYITAFLTLIYSNLTFFTRYFIKWKVLGADDWSMCLGQVAFMVQFSFLLVSLSAGLGRNFGLLGRDQYSRMASWQYANQIVLFVALGFSKIGTILLVQRLFTRDARKFRMICHIVTIIMILWTVLSAFMVSVGCSPTSIAPASEEQICPGIIIRYRAVAITDVLTDVLLILAPAYLVCQLQMTSKLKLQVITVFALRLPLISLSILSLTSFQKSLHSTNPGVDRSPAIIFQQSQLCCSLIAATLPCLKSFIRSFDTGSGLNVNYSSNRYGSSGYGGGESYRMQSITKDSGVSKSRDPDKSHIKVNRQPFTRDGHAHAHAYAHGRTGSTSQVTTRGYASCGPNEEDAARHGSQELFIRRDVQWEVRSENIQSSGKDDDIAEERKESMEAVARHIRLRND